MTAEELNRKETELGEKVMSLSVGKLLLRQHYFSSAVGRLLLRQSAGSMYTDGNSLCYDAGYILKRYSLSDTLPVHDLLHTLLHNVFRHWKIGSVEAKLWDTACDIAVEAMISSISPELVPDENSEKRMRILRKLSGEVRPLTAEKLYNYLHNNNISDESLSEYAHLFSIDDHRPWHKTEDENNREYEDEEKLDTMPVSDGDDSDNDESSGSSDGESDDGDKDGSEAEDTDASDGGEDSGSGSETNAVEQWLTQQQELERSELEKQWKEIAEQIRSELESFGKNENSLQLIEVLEHIDRDKTDYTDLLRRFAVSGEVMRADLDSFDVGFYCYGMELYGDVAFIEPPEYKEVKRVRDFVIAIDTSASVSRETVREFVQKTYSILKSEESFFSRVNIHILQCDVRIQDAAVINCEDDIRKYIDGLELKGFGGTDFRPVFEYIAAAREKGELSELKGMIYFTDGLGTFPEKAPDYETAFVFVQGVYEKNSSPEVPPWAAKVMLEEGALSDGR